MQKTKAIIGLIGAVVIGLFVVRPVSASVLAIQSLPSYITTNNFKLSCTSDGGSVQFSYNKNGGGWINFGSAIDTDTNPCVIQVDSSVVNDQTSYVFAANGVQSNSTFYDISGPSPVSGYYKERTSDGSYKLHWKNPGDSDFDKVVIYRGDTVDFSADSSHEIARVSGGSNADMTYDDNFTPDSSKTYFYAIRALDHAGNSSSLVGDGSTTTTTTTTTATPKAGGGKVTVLPKEQGTGSVLGTETTPTAQPEASQTPQASAGAFNLFTWIMGHKKISLGVLIIIALLGYYALKARKD